MGGVGAKAPAAASEGVAREGSSRGSGRPSQGRWAGGPRERREWLYWVEASLTTVGASVHIDIQYTNEESFHGFCLARCCRRNELPRSGPRC